MLGVFMRTNVLWNLQVVVLSTFELAVQDLGQ